MITKNIFKFASIAEASAHFYKLGYKTVAFTDYSKIMRKDRNEVMINRESFLDVIAEELVLE